MKNQSKKLVAVLAGVAAVILVGQVGSVRTYITEIRDGPGTQNAFDMFKEATGEDALLSAIRDKAAETKIAPVNAKVDRVWKAIPGYNGMEIDVEATYRKALGGNLNTKISYVYRQVEPEIQLKDLGAHPIYRGNPAKPMVSFMINVAWGNEHIIPMLDILEAEKVKATFFLDGSWLKKNAELAKEIQKRGHELSNHAYSHPNMSRLSAERARLEIGKTEDLLKETLGVENRWFAPPSGDFNQKTVDIASSMGLQTVLWTLDTVDWRKPSSASIVDKIAAKVEAGTLILMHPTASSSGALKGMIQSIRSKGLVLGTVSETLSSERIKAPAVE
ncbi:polysaccharide deacetylase family protein [Paenibacillus xylanilyticus]|uniref:Polysaccharide deacetylase family protein n=1 Tax=Paenibacillus xylanilyticus TaxID=248903 RepID=A0A7Y6BWJ9_9BACL|nr:polysaccharide deacetylase family protein [Paenibacillus xylanilyticus]NUU76303.1 polysaccharide deacetylase family protein [Paenibacillus xylanilyticus]